MTALRISSVNFLSFREIEVEFTNALSDEITTNNVRIEPTNSAAVPVPEILSINVSDNVLQITTLPLTPLTSYRVVCSGEEFLSADRRFGLIEDGIANVKVFITPIDSANPIREKLEQYLKDQIYNLEPSEAPNANRLVLDGLAHFLARGLYDLRQQKNDNFLGFTVTDEQKVRGEGPYDRLNEEGAYQILRIGKNPTGVTATRVLEFDSLGPDPVSLQTVRVANEILVFGSSEGTFRDLILTTNQFPVSKLTSATVLYENGSEYEINLQRYGYSILDNRYDTELAFSNNLLTNRQFVLSNELLEDEDFILPASGDRIEIAYEYRDLGIEIDSESIDVFLLQHQIREVVPPLVHSFTLRYAPIVPSATSTTTAEFGAVEFKDPNSNPPCSGLHPAFEREIPFRLEAPPKSPGEFAVNYETGQVLVYGSSEEVLGTGLYPPSASYHARKSYVKDSDWDYDEVTSDLVSYPLRPIRTENQGPVYVEFDYEKVLVEGQDFKSQVHSESLEERIQNRLASTISLKTLHAPITNVFRIFNETSGEVYKIDYWNDDTIYFVSQNQPRTVSIVSEPVSFELVTNETIEVTDESINDSSLRILYCSVLNSPIINTIEDAIGTIFNSSLSLDDSDIWIAEKYFDTTLELVTNLNRLTSIGDYCVNYETGQLYVAVSTDQNYRLGSASYRHGKIVTAQQHILSVNNLRHEIDEESQIVEAESFADHTITPSSYFYSDERFLNNDLSLPYVVDNDTITLTNRAFEVRGLYELENLVNSFKPRNFADAVTIDSNDSRIINLGELTVVENLIIETNGVDLILNPDLASDGIDLISITSLTRLSDQTTLSGSVVNGQIVLGVTGSPTIGEEIRCVYTLKLNGSATPLVDYSKGNYLVDYTYLADEILVSYEYGDNSLDFRQSNTLDPGETYYVTYQAGALRDSLLANFGSLINLDILRVFDPTLPRERYREAVQGALQMLHRGPTIGGLSRLVEFISHMQPEIIEGFLQVWSLGSSKLYLSNPKVEGNPTLAPGRYDSGLRFSGTNDALSLPANSNLRLEGGTFETWIIPEWNGLDNDAILTFENLQLDGNQLNENQIYIGSSSYHPELSTIGTFSLSRFDSASTSALGLPGAIFTATSGLFIYYDTDEARWKLLAKYPDSSNGIFSGKITSSGEVYHVQKIPGMGDLSDVLRSTRASIEFEFHFDGYDSSSPDGYLGTDGYQAGFSFDGISWMADEEHFLWDVGAPGNEKRNRMALYKDGRGYLTFCAWSRDGTLGQISADISNWRAGERHHVATAWRLNTSTRKDEMHLFVDGLEVPNLMRFGGRPATSETDRFRTVIPEQVLANVTRPVITGRDLNISNGSNLVIANSTDFGSLGILAGDTLEILESGIENTYTITAVSGTALTLSGTLSTNLNNVWYSANPIAVNVSTEIPYFPNIAVSVYRGGEEIELPGLRAASPSYLISSTIWNEYYLKLIGNLEIGDQVWLRTLGLNHRRFRDSIYLWSNSNLIRSQFPSALNLDDVKIIKTILPETYVSLDNSVISGSDYLTTITNNLFSPTNVTEGRSLSVRINRNNTNLNFPVTVTINGTDSGGPYSEVLVFGLLTGLTLNTTGKFTSVTSVDITSTPYTLGNRGLGIVIREQYSATFPEGNNSYPVLRLSQQLTSGINLVGTVGSDQISDATQSFSSNLVGQTLIISSPLGEAGSYLILEVIDEQTLRIDTALGINFTGGAYTIQYLSPGREGFQNGFYYLEEAGADGNPYLLSSGWYEIDQQVALHLPWKPLDFEKIIFGNSISGNKSAKAVLDEIVILNVPLTDLRVGEEATGERTVTSDFYRLKEIQQTDSSTLVLLHLNELPATNSADYWAFNGFKGEYLPTEFSLNEEFGSAIVFDRQVWSQENLGYWNRKSGTLEFWVSPMFDTYNDPEKRYYFDATSAITETVVSLTATTLEASNRISKLLGVYIVGDTTEKNYVNDATVDDRTRKIIELTDPLPSAGTSVRLVYLVAGQYENRFSVYKDEFGYLKVEITSSSSGDIFELSRPIAWARNTWHRIWTSWRFNSSTSGNDEIRLLVDGEEYTVLKFGQAGNFGEGQVFGQTGGGENARLNASISFSQTPNRLYFGGDYIGKQIAMARIDNLRLSNVARTPVTIGNQAIDVFYQPESSALPVQEDGVTTYLLNFDSVKYREDDFSILRNVLYGLFNLTIQVFDSYGIIAESNRVKELFEGLLKAYKPARAKLNIQYYS